MKKKYLITMLIISTMQPAHAETIVQYKTNTLSSECTVDPNDDTKMYCNEYCTMTNKNTGTPFGGKNNNWNCNNETKRTQWANDWNAIPSNEKVSNCNKGYIGADGGYHLGQCETNSISISFSSSTINVNGACGNYNNCWDDFEFTFDSLANNPFWITAVDSNGLNVVPQLSSLGYSFAASITRLNEWPTNIPHAQRCERNNVSWNMATQPMTIGSGNDQGDLGLEVTSLCNYQINIEEYLNGSFVKNHTLQVQFRTEYTRF